MKLFDRCLCVALLAVGAMILHLLIDNAIRLDRIELQYERTFGPPIHPVKPAPPYPDPRTKFA